MSICKVIPQVHFLSLSADTLDLPVVASEHFAGVLPGGAFTALRRMEGRFLGHKRLQNGDAKILPTAFHLCDFKRIKGIPDLWDSQLGCDLRGRPISVGRQGRFPLLHVHSLCFVQASSQ